MRLPVCISLPHEACRASSTRLHTICSAMSASRKRLRGAADLRLLLQTLLDDIVRDGGDRFHLDVFQ